MSSRPIVAVDGESAGDSYNLLVAGTKVLKPKIFDYLHSVEIFEFLLSLPAEPYLVGYYIGFDATHWLRNVPPEKCERIFLENKEIFGNYTWFKRYGIQYIPGQFFRVCRILPGSHPPKVLKGSARTVNEVSGFWRSPFVDMLKTMRVASVQEVQEIQIGKDARGREALPPDQVLRYCKLECRLLAKAMTKLRSQFEGCGYPLHDYRGAGSAASAILTEQRQIPKRPDEPTRPARVDVAHEQHRYPDDTRWRRAVMTAFFGGRIETRTTGEIDRVIYEYDRRGSYCADLRALPCPKHTNWVKFRGEPKGWRWYLAQGSWRTDEQIPWGPLPTRTAAQAIIYPRSVEGWWWSPELEGLEEFQFKGGWGADKDCDCDPFDFIDDLYAERLARSEDAGLPLKIGMAAITGKFAQHKHRASARWRDMVIAGLTYSSTRAAVRQLLDEHTLQVATDAVYTTLPLALKQTSALGDWSMTELKKGLLIVRPGIFWDRDQSLLRARGFAKHTILKHVESITRSWRDWNPLLPPPVYTIPTELFIGHRTAVTLNRPELLGTWKKMDIPLSFDWQPRRSAMFELMPDGNHCHVVTFAPNRHQKSVVYDPSLVSEMEKMGIQLMEQPDG